MAVNAVIPMVGEPIMTWEQVEALPTGARIHVRNSPQRFYIKQDDGTWQDWRGITCLSQDFSYDGYNVLASMPVGGKATYPTLRQWQWKWLDNAWMSAEQAGVQARTVETGMERLGLTWDMFPVGEGLVLRSRHALNRVPDGSLFFVGDLAAANGNGNGYGLFVKPRGGEPVHLLGAQQGFVGLPLHVGQVPDGQVADWFVEQNHDVATTEAVNEFKARAWRVGWKIKQQHGWCASYETYMRQVGLDADATRLARSGGLAVGDRCNPEQAATLAVGTVLRWVSSNHPERWQWFIRDDTVVNAGRTRLLFGTATEHRSYRTSMEVLAFGSGDPADLDCPISRNEAAHLPPGSVVTINGTSLIMCQDSRFANDDPRYHTPLGGLAVPTRGQWLASDFGADAMLVSVAHE